MDPQVQVRPQSGRLRRTSRTGGSDNRDVCGIANRRSNRGLQMKGRRATRRSRSSPQAHKLFFVRRAWSRLVIFHRVVPGSRSNPAPALENAKTNGMNRPIEGIDVVDVDLWDAPYGFSGRSRARITPGRISRTRIRLTIDLVFGFRYVLLVARASRVPASLSVNWSFTRFRLFDLSTVIAGPRPTAVALVFRPYCCRLRGRQVEYKMEGRPNTTASRIQFRTGGSRSICQRSWPFWSSVRPTVVLITRTQPMPEPPVWACPSINTSTRHAGARSSRWSVHRRRTAWGRPARSRSISRAYPCPPRVGLGPRPGTRSPRTWVGPRLARSRPPLRWGRHPRRWLGTRWAPRVRAGRPRTSTVAWAPTTSAPSIRGLGAI
jgi:hypothetical protein